jgi:hypothetical protein
MRPEAAFASCGQRAINRRGDIAAQSHRHAANADRQWVTPHQYALMQRLDCHPWFKTQRAQTMTLLIGQGFPINRPNDGDLVQRKMIKLHGRYLQPIRNNINRDLY